MDHFFSNCLKNYPDVLTPNQLKDILNVGKNKIYDMLQSGEIKSVRVGNQYRIPKNYIYVYLYQK